MKSVDWIATVVALVIVLVVPYLIWMGIWEFATWGEAVWYLGDWNTIPRTFYLFYNFVFVFFVLLADS